MLDAKMKQCKLCALVKPPEKFYPSPKTRDGLSSYCSDCVSEIDWMAREKKSSDAIKWRRRKHRNA